MPTGLKVLHGSRSAHAPRLCDTCTYGVVRRGASESEEHVFCQKIERGVRMRVVECNVYQNRNHPPLWAMKEIAWVLHTDTRRERIGFLKSIEWQRKHEDESIIPGHYD